MWEIRRRVQLHRIHNGRLNKFVWKASFNAPMTAEFNEFVWKTSPVLG